MPLKGRTLIATDAPLVSALIGLLIESSGGQPLFPSQDEPLSEAIVRLRPLSLAVLGVGLSEAHSDLFFALAERQGIRIAICGSDEQLHELADVAAQRGLAWFSLPPTQRGLDAATQPVAERRTPASDDRRQDARSSVAADGTTILTDQRGTLWLVYDRRASTVRRQGDARVDRTFVSEQGERFSCGVDAAVATDTSPMTLVDQLMRAQADAARA